MHDAPDLIEQHMLDGNAAAGILYEIFGEEMTGCMCECDNCGREGELGGLLAFMPIPGIVLRCPACENVLLRLVQTPDHIYLDARGAVYLRIARTAR